MTATVTQKNPGWISRLAKSYKNIDTLAIGIPIGSEGASLAYPEGEELLDVAVQNNFGTDKIPRRDYMTPGGQAAVKKTAPIAKEQLKLINAGEQDVVGALTAMGPTAAAEMQLTIRDFDTPPNAAETIELKGSANPLVDTGLLQQSQTWSVRKK